MLGIRVRQNVRRGLLCFTWQIIVINIIRHCSVLQLDRFDLGRLWLCLISLMSFVLTLVKAVCIVVFFFVWRSERRLISIVVERCTIVEQVGRL